MTVQVWSVVHTLWPGRWEDCCEDLSQQNNWYDTFSLPNFIGVSQENVRDYLPNKLTQQTSSQAWILRGP